MSQTEKTLEHAAHQAIVRANDQAQVAAVVYSQLMTTSVQLQMKIIRETGETISRLLEQCVTLEDFQKLTKALKGDE